MQVPGNIRRAEHFVQFLRRFMEYLRQRMGAASVEQETPTAFLANLQAAVAIDGEHWRCMYLRACTQHAICKPSAWVCQTSQCSGNLNGTMGCL